MRAHPHDRSLDPSLLTRLQQKSKPRNARREIFVVTRAAMTCALRLCANWTGVRVRNMRQMAMKSTRLKQQKQPRYQ